MREIGSNSLRIYKKAISGKASFSGAVKAKCYECCNFEDLHERVGGCTVKACPLWMYRPFRPAGEGRAKTRKGPRSGSNPSVQNSTNKRQTEET